MAMKIAQSALIILLIAVILMYNKDIINFEFIYKYLKIKKFQNNYEYRSSALSDDLFNTEVAMTENANDAITDALKNAI